MSQLSPLHERLQAIGAHRHRARALVAYGVLAWSAALGLLVWFALDWQQRLQRGDRALLSVLLVGWVVWSFRRWGAAWLKPQESEVDIALWVEQRSHIENDLVAALQFDAPVAARWGSMQLQGAVIDRAATLRPATAWADSCHGIPYRAYGAAWLALAALVLATCLFFPGHVQALFWRLLGASAPYPTETRLVEIRVDEHRVLAELNAADDIRVPFGSAPRLSVTVSGRIPATGHATIQSTTDGSRRTVELLPRVADDDTAFHAELPRFVEDVLLSLSLGDAYREPFLVRVMPLPVVTLQTLIEAPDYVAATAAATEAATQTQQATVLEGSRVTLEIHCRNKALRSAQATIGEQVFALHSRDDSRRTWYLPPDNTPFAAVESHLPYQIDVIDSDGLSLDQPLQGSLRVRADLPPRVRASLVSQLVLPSAKPIVRYEVMDDHGVAEIQLHCQVVRDDEPGQEITLPVTWDRQQPIQVKGKQSVDLSALKLKKGDQVRLIVAARDDRGARSGKVAESETLLVRVTDRSGVLAAIGETDERSARQMEQIIQRQLGQGDTP